MASLSAAGSPLSLDEILQWLLSTKESERAGWSCLVVGRMGVGKTQLLDKLAKFCGLRRPALAEIRSRLARSDCALVSVLPGSIEERVRLLSFCGLNTVPSWLTPFRLLSGGEQARVLTGLQLQQGAQILDNFGNCLDKQSASMAALAAQRLLPPNDAVVLATQAPEMARFLQPDYVIWISEPESPAAQDVHTQQRFYLLRNPNRRGERRPTVAMSLDTSTGAHDVAPAPRFNTSIRGGGKLMAPGPLKGLRTTVRLDDATDHVSRCTQLQFSGVIEKQFVELPISSIDARLDKWRLGVLIGASGSGKSVTLRRLPRLSTLPDAAWGGRSVLAVLGGNTDEARKRARAAGLSHAQWTRPYAKLSAGEQAAACLAYALRPADNNADCIVAVDEAFSFHDPASARVSAHKLRAFLRDSPSRNRTKLVLAGAAIDDALLAILQPDWIFDPSKPAGARDALRVFLTEPDPPADSVEASATVAPPSAAELFERARFRGTVRRVRHADWQAAWGAVKRFHYLSEQFPNDAINNIFVLRCDATGELVGFIAYGSYCGRARAGDARKLLQERRLVVVPQWQGMRLGPTLSETIGAFIVAGGATQDRPARYSSVTANAALGAQRSASGLWKATAGNGKLSGGGAHGAKDRKRYIQFCHEFVGAKPGAAAAAPAGWHAPPPRPLSSAGGSSSAAGLRPPPPPRPPGGLASAGSAARAESYSRAPQPQSSAAGLRAPPPPRPTGGSSAGGTASVDRFISVPRSSGDAARAAEGWRPAPPPTGSPGLKRARAPSPLPAPTGIAGLLAQMNPAKKPRPDIGRISADLWLKSATDAQAAASASAFARAAPMPPAAGAAPRSPSAAAGAAAIARAAAAASARAAASATPPEAARGGAPPEVIVIDDETVDEVFVINDAEQAVVLVDEEDDDDDEDDGCIVLD